MPFRNYGLDHKAELIIDLVASVEKEKLLGVEVGVWKGDTSAKLLAYFENLTMIGVDPYSDFSGYAERDKIPMSLIGEGIDHKLWLPTKTRGDMMFESVTKKMKAEFGERFSLLRMPSADGAFEIKDASLDFIYIDGNHCYDFVKQDIALWWPKVKAGGVMIGDDFAWLGRSEHVAKAVIETFGYDFGVMADTWWKFK